MQRKKSRTFNEAYSTLGKFDKRGTAPTLLKRADQREGGAVGTARMLRSGWLLARKGTAATAVSEIVLQKQFVRFLLLQAAKAGLHETRAFMLGILRSFLQQARTLAKKKARPRAKRCRRVEPHGMRASHIWMRRECPCAAGGLPADAQVTMWLRRRT